MPPALKASFCSGFRSRLVTLLRRAAALARCRLFGSGHVGHGRLGHRARGSRLRRRDAAGRSSQESRQGCGIASIGNGARRAIIPVAARPVIARPIIASPCLDGTRLERTFLAGLLLAGAILARAIVAGTVVSWTVVAIAVLTGAVVAGPVIPRTIIAGAIKCDGRKSLIVAIRLCASKGACNASGAPAARAATGPATSPAKDVG
jgi:hypothetical protein